MLALNIRRQWLWTAALIAFIVISTYCKLDWSPVLVPSAILTWYGAIRRATRHGEEE